MMIERIPPELEGRLKTCRSLPSPPTYGLKVIDLVNDPELDIDQAVKVFSLDPVIVSQILRIANSPLYASQRKVDTLQMAILLQAQVRRSDVVGRFGGEEFLIVLSGTPSVSAQDVFLCILEAFRGMRHDVADGQHIGITASIGIATHSPKRSFSTIRELIKAADDALYHGKQHGRNNCLRYEDIPAELTMVSSSPLS